MHAVLEPIGMLRDSVASSAPTTKSSRWRRSTRLERSVESVVGELDARHSQRGDRFVDRAVGLSARVGLGDAAAVKQAGRSVVALAGGDRALRDRGRGDVGEMGADYQTRPASRGSQRSASRVTLTSLLDDRLDLLLDLLDHRAGVGAERRRQDHLDLGELGRLDDLLDQRQLDDVHADLRIDHGAQRIEDRELVARAWGSKAGAAAAVAAVGIGRKSDQSCRI